MLKLDPVKYWVAEKTEGPWWNRQRQYYVESEFSALGPYNTRRAADAALREISSI